MYAKWALIITVFIIPFTLSESSRKIIETCDPNRES